VLSVRGLIKVMMFQQMMMTIKETKLHTSPEDDSSPSSPMSSYVSDEEIEENGDDDGISDAEKDIHDFEEHELNHDIAFSHHKRLICLLHTLQLVVRTFDTIHSPKRAVKKAHKVVKKVCKSTKATERLIGLCRVKLIADCPTRWNSTYPIIARLLKVRPALTQVLQELVGIVCRTVNGDSLRAYMKSLSHLPAIPNLSVESISLQFQL